MGGETFVPRFDGQAERLEMTADQMRLLASPAVAEVFDFFRYDEERSIPEVAKALSKSQAAVGAQVAALLEAGFLIVTGTRRSRARTERLFAKSSRFIVASFEGKPWEYYEAAIDGYNAWMRRHMRAHALLRRRIFLLTEERDFHEFLIGEATVTRHGALKIKRAIREFDRTLEAIGEEHRASEGKGEQVQFLLTMNPSEATSRRRLKELESPKDP